MPDLVPTMPIQPELLLLHELNHRINNEFASLVSIVSSSRVLEVQPTKVAARRVKPDAIWERPGVGALSHRLGGWIETRAMITPIVSAVPWVFAFSIQAKQSIVVDPTSPGGVRKRDRRGYFRFAPMQWPRDVPLRNIPDGRTEGHNLALRRAAAVTRIQMGCARSFARGRAAIF
jgi:hypothetical protein